MNAGPFGNLYRIIADTCVIQLWGYYAPEVKMGKAKIKEDEYEGIYIVYLLPNTIIQAVDKSEGETHVFSWDGYKLAGWVAEEETS